MTEVEPRAERSYHAGSALFIRAFGLVYLVAFVSLAIQARGLLGSRGISPIAERMDLVRERGLSLFDVPTLFRYVDSDVAIFSALAIGVFAAVALCVARGRWRQWSQRAAIVICWVVYLSFVNAGGSFFAYQWDALLLEASVVALFFSPRDDADPRVGRAVVTFLLFRLMFSSGFVKLSSGDAAWRDLSAMTYHYLTQPLPHVLGYYAHHLPAWFHSLAAIGMFAIELVLPFAFFVPGWPRRVAVLATIALQLLITLTGNYGFFNLLAIALCLPLLDDALLRRPVRVERETRRRAPLAFALVYVLAASLSFLPTLGAPTIGSVRYALAPFHSTNAYGLFAVMTRERPEIVFEGRFGEEWIEYALPVKPVALDRAPRFAFFHLPRLDWGLWFAAIGSRSHGRMVPRVADALRRAEPSVLALFANTPDSRPDDVRVRFYKYGFADVGSDDWWTREESF